MFGADSDCSWELIWALVMTWPMRSRITVRGGWARRDSAGRRRSVRARVEHRRLRQGARPELRCEVQLSVSAPRDAAALPAREGARGAGAVLVGHAEHRAALAGQPFLRLLEQRRLTRARIAPRGPE